MSGVTGLAASGSASTTSPWKECTNLQIVPKMTLATANMYTNYLFLNCTSLVYFGGIGGNGYNTQAYYHTFEGCSSLEWIGELPTLRFPMVIPFSGCSRLRHIEMVDWTNCNETSNSYSSNDRWKSNGNTALRYVVIKNIGKTQTTRYCFLHSLTAWGKNSTDEPNARQSLVDSLLTYSFDRAQANADAKQAAIDAGTYDESTWTDPYLSHTIRMATATYNLLTAEEREAITAKGHTLLAV